MKQYSMQPSGAMTMMLMTLAILLIAFLSPCDAVNCTAQYQCMGVSAQYDFVSCTAGSCICKTSQGISGNATAQWPCGCSAPGSVYWIGGQPYCIDIPAAAASISRNDILKAQARKVYTNLITPTASKIISGEVSVDDVFAPVSVGRIDPVGVFDSRPVLLEYYYVFAATDASYVQSVDFVSLFASGNEAFVRVNILFVANTPGVQPFNVTQTARYRFDSNNKITSVDGIIHNMGRAVDPPAVQSVRDYLIASMCTKLTVNPGPCNATTDPLGYYSSFQDCVDFMHSLEYGSYDQTFSDTVTCRSVHTTLAVVDPHKHCPHTGKTGGGKCRYWPYTEYYTYDF